MKNKIFITGGAGYCGSRLVPYLLEKNFIVTVYDIMYFTNNFLPKQHPNLTIIKGDIRDTEKLKESCVNKSTELKRYVLNRLRAADGDLIKYPSDKKSLDDLKRRKKPLGYSRQCGEVVMRQPIVIKIKEKNEIDIKYRDSYSSALRYGSTESKKLQYYYTKMGKFRKYCFHNILIIIFLYFISSEF